MAHSYLFNSNIMPGSFRATVIKKELEMTMQTNSVKILQVNQQRGHPLHFAASTASKPSWAGSNILRDFFTLAAIGCRQQDVRPVKQDNESK